jgi:hypothetical protein
LQILQRKLEVFSTRGTLNYKFFRLFAIKSKVRNTARNLLNQHAKRIRSGTAGWEDGVRVPVRLVGSLGPSTRLQLFGPRVALAAQELEILFPPNYLVSGKNVRQGTAGPEVSD